jgi:CRP-like cAMP-binding protein
MERHPKLAMNAVRFVAAQLHELQAEYRQLATEKVERRVARALVRLVQQAGRRPRGDGVRRNAVTPMSFHDNARMPLRTNDSSPASGQRHRRPVSRKLTY